MLRLTRYEGQRIRINDDIIIVVRAVDRQTGRVRLDIEAPRDVDVHREEIYQRIKAERAGLVPPPELNGQFQRQRSRNERRH